MFNLILQIIIFSSLGLVIYMIARAIPRVPEETATPRRSNWVDRLMSKIPMTKIDENINSFFSKLLRKAKVVVMKADNFINDRLGKLTKKSGPATPPAPSQDEHKTVL
ncbi:MAG: hypothetical protein Q8L24_01430 [bacterium]|nr:hypothetical protein [bacterium]